jgi:hypothetical protein
MRVAGEEGHVWPRCYGTIPFQEELKGVPHFQWFKHCQVHANKPAFSEARQKLGDWGAIAEGAAHENKVRVIFGVNRTPINPAFKRRGQCNVIRMTGVFEPLANKIAGEEIPGCSPHLLKTKPTCYERFHGQTSSP